MPRPLCCFFVLLLFSLFAAAVDPSVVEFSDKSLGTSKSSQEYNVAVDLNGDGNYERVRVVEAVPAKVPQNYFEDDCYHLTIETFSPPHIYSEDFCTSYGAFTMHILHLTPGPFSDFVFELLEGRGTHATLKKIVIKHWDGYRLVTQLEIPAEIHFSNRSQDGQIWAAGTCKKSCSFVKNPSNGYYSMKLSLTCEEWNGTLYRNLLDSRDRGFVDSKEEVWTFDPKCKRFCRMPAEPLLIR